jgi:hypothetical protein
MVVFGREIFNWTRLLVASSQKNRFSVVLEAGSIFGIDVYFLVMPYPLPPLFTGLLESKT